MTERYHLIIEQKMLTEEEERMKKIKKLLSPQQTTRLAEIKAKLDAMPPKYYFDSEDIAIYEQTILNLATRMVNLTIDAKAALQERSTGQWTKDKLTKVRSALKILYCYLYFYVYRKKSKLLPLVWKSPLIR
jgi:hypothetical protein